MACRSPAASPAIRASSVLGSKVRAARMAGVSRDGQRSTAANIEAPLVRPGPRWPRHNHKTDEGGPRRQGPANYLAPDPGHPASRGELPPVPYRGHVISQESLLMTESPLTAFSNHAAELVARAADSIVAVHGGGRRSVSGIHWRPGIIVT